MRFNLPFFSKNLCEREASQARLSQKAAMLGKQNTGLCVQ
jgi:hypothetical protein